MKIINENTNLTVLIEQLKKSNKIYLEAIDDVLFKIKNDDMKEVLKYTTLLEKWKNDSDKKYNEFKKAMFKLF